MTLPPDEGLEWNRFLNGHLLKATKQIPFLVPLATVPMQSGKLAAQALEEALDQGFHGAMIGTQPKGASGVLDDPDLNPFWEVASARKATLFVHPTFGARDDRLKAYGLVSAVGRVTDTTLGRRAASLFRSSGALSRRQPCHLAWRRGTADGVRPSQAQFRDGAGAEHRPGSGLSQALFRFRRLRRPHRPLCLRHCRRRSRADGHRRAVCHCRAAAGQADRSVQFQRGRRQAILGGTAARLFRIS